MKALNLTPLRRGSVCAVNSGVASFGGSELSGLSKSQLCDLVVTSSRYGSEVDVCKLGALGSVRQAVVVYDHNDSDMDSALFSPYCGPLPAHRVFLSTKSGHFVVASSSPITDVEHIPAEALIIPLRPIMGIVDPIYFPAGPGFSAGSVSHPRAA